jgi:hypothetical protein
MNRRNFVKTASTEALTGIASGSISGYAGNLLSSEFDKYGGWTGKKFEATGYFRVIKEDRWWIVSPEGNVFLGFGINHLVPDLFNRDLHKKEMQKFFGLIDLSWENPDYRLASKNVTCKLVKTLIKTCTTLYQKLSTTKLMITIITINQLSLNL